VRESRGAGVTQRTNKISVTQRNFQRKKNILFRFRAFWLLKREKKRKEKKRKEKKRKEKKKKRKEKEKKRKEKKRKKSFSCY